LADHREVSECPTCKRPLVTITMTLSDIELQMRSCSKCDRRFWQSDGEDIELTGMLGRVPALQPALR
jgi:hypothetical protein